MSLAMLFFLLSIPVLLVAVLALGFWWGAQRKVSRVRRELEAKLTVYQQMMNSSDIATVLLDDSCYVLTWNTQLGRLHDCRVDHIQGEQFFMRFAPKSEAATLTARAMSMRTSDAPFVLRYSVIDRLGNKRTLQWQARFFTDEAASRCYLAMTGSDVSALEAALAEVSYGEARMRLLFDAVPLPLVLVSPEGEVRLTNPSGAEFWGYESADQMIGRDLAQHIHPDDREACATSFAALNAQEKESCKLEIRYLRRDGDFRWGQGSGVMVEMAPGQLFVFIQVRDIHRQKITEQALRDHEQQLSRLLSNLSGAVYHYALSEENILRHHDHQFYFVSEGVKAITGLSENKFLASVAPQIFGQLIIEADKPLLEKNMREAVKGDGRFKVEYRVRHDMLGIRWVSEQGLVWQQPDGRWTVDGHIVDITVERMAYESEQVYRRLIADTNTGYLCVTTCGRVLEVNQPYCDMFGAAEPEVMQGKLLEELFPDHRDLIRGFLDVVVREGGVHDVEKCYKRLDGQKVYVLTNAIAVQESGQLLIKCLTVDTTRIRQAERAKQESEHRYRELLSGSDTGICVAGLEGRIEKVNAAFCRIVGEAGGEESLQGKHLLELGAVLWQDADTKALDMVLNKGFCDPYCRELTRSDGSTIPIRVNAWLESEADGKPKRISFMVTDLSVA